jgi:hypothetical protein
MGLDLPFHGLGVTIGRGVDELLGDLCLVIADKVLEGHPHGSEKDFTGPIEARLPDRGFDSIESGLASVQFCITSACVQDAEALIFLGEARENRGEALKYLASCDRLGRELLLRRDEP